MKKTHILLALLVAALFALAAVSCASGDAGGAPYRTEGCLFYKEMRRYTGAKERYIAITGCDKERLPADLVIPEKIDGLPVADIADGAFNGCTAIKSVFLPDTVTRIGYNSFRGCKALEKIRFSQSLEIIDYAAFWGCESLGYIELPSSLKHIEGYAFSHCFNVKVYMDDVTVGPWCFSSLTCPEDSSLVDQLLENAACAMITSNTVIVEKGFLNCTAYINHTFSSDEYPALKQAFSPRKRVFFGAVFGQSEDGSPYVYSVPCKTFSCQTGYNMMNYPSLPKAEFDNPHPSNVYAQPPFRSGYTFLGWALTENAEKPSFVNPYSVALLDSKNHVYAYSYHCIDANTGEVTDLSHGTVLYSVWSKND